VSKFWPKIVTLVWGEGWKGVSDNVRTWVVSERIKRSREWSVFDNTDRKDISKTAQCDLLPGAIVHFGFVLSYDGQSKNEILSGQYNALNNEGAAACRV